MRVAGDKAKVIGLNFTMEILEGHAEQLVFFGPSECPQRFMWAVELKFEATHLCIVRLVF